MPKRNADFRAKPKGLCIFIKSAKFLIWLLKNDKLKTKYKNSVLCESEKLVSFYTLRFIHKTVVCHWRKTVTIVLLYRQN